MKLRNYIALMKNEACCNIVTVHSATMMKRTLLTCWATIAARFTDARLNGTMITDVRVHKKAERWVKRLMERSPNNG